MTRIVACLLRARIELVPSCIGARQRLLQLGEPRQRVVDRRRRLLVEVRIRDFGIQRNLLAFERLDPRRQLRELPPLLVGQLASRRGPRLYKGYGPFFAGRRRRRSSRASRAALPQPVVVPADVFLDTAAAFERERARDDVVEEGAIVADEQQRAGPVNELCLEQLERLE